MAKRRLNFIDIFSGCGGMSTGMEMAGHKCLLGVDFDRHAVESFKTNHPRAKAICADINKLEKKTLLDALGGQKVDMVVGGPPCQGFSTAGRNNPKDPRNVLFKQFVRVVEITRPEYIVFENVTGMLSGKNRKTLETIFGHFEKLGYAMRAKVLSADEFQTPSKRKRAIIIGRKGAVPSFPAPGEKRVSVKRAFSKIRKNDPNHDLEFAAVKCERKRKQLACVPAGKYVRNQKDEDKYLPKGLKMGVEWDSLPERRFRQAKLQRLPWDLPAPTILTSSRLYYHPEENRHLTVREAALCQGFPADFVFKGPKGAQFRQVGNAVPPTLARAIGEELAQDKSGEEEGEKEELAQFTKGAFKYR